MNRYVKLFLAFLLIMPVVAANLAKADAASDLAKQSRIALKTLYKQAPGAKELGAVAKAVLVFPKITKGGFVIGAQYGKGTLFKGDQVAGFYNTAAASYGLQAGLQQFGYALFFLQESDLKYLDKSDGWELGVGPSVTVIDEGLANSMSTTTMREGVYAYFFGQKGLMAGLGVQGSKITKINPNS